MKNILLTITLVLCSMASFAQVIINEIDSDTPSTDQKEFIELKSVTPFLALNGYVLVMYNGSSTASTSNKSYYTIDLDGLTTDANGLAVIGNAMVAPVPIKVFANSTMQNGPDVIALYIGNASDFPDQTTATATNLVSAAAYSNNSEDCISLRTILGIPAIYNENSSGNAQTESIQRKPDGTFETKAPTPGSNNDGSGTVFNGITITSSVTEFTEGATFTLAFTTQSAVASALVFDFTLTNDSFTTADFTGSTTVTIPTGSSSFTTVINSVDDNIDEGDELGKVAIDSVPTGYVRMNNNIEVRIIDNDFTTAAWGTPLAPTYGLVNSSAPNSYYASLEGKSGAALKQAIQDIIADSSLVHKHNYGDVTDILKKADQNPLNSNQVWLMYVEQGRAKYKFQTTASNTGSWNREHIYPQSRGGFTDGTSSFADGITVWETTNADDINAAHGDAHHIRSEDGPENSSRNNRDYGLNDYNGPQANQGSWHGDVARSVFYMACRYNGLDVVNGNPADSTVGQLGDLATLLQWNTTDPVDDFEMNRNNVVYTWQLNRNPFIDYPNLANYLWGANVGETWSASLAVPENSNGAISLFPNPVQHRLSVTGTAENSSLEIFSIYGQQLYHTTFSGDTTLEIDLPAAVYVARVISASHTAIKKIIVAY